MAEFTHQFTNNQHEYVVINANPQQLEQEIRTLLAQGMMQTFGISVYFRDENTLVIADSRTPEPALQRIELAISRHVVDPNYGFSEQELRIITLLRKGRLNADETYEAIRILALKTFPHIEPRL